MDGQMDMGEFIAPPAKAGKKNSQNSIFLGMWIFHLALYGMVFK